MNKRTPKYIKLIRMLISNDKRLLFISIISLVIGFTFLFTVSSMSDTIVKAEQENIVNKYGKFLVVIPEISREDEEEIRQQYSQFAYEDYGIIGNVEYTENKITMGTMKENMGEIFGFRLLRGKWPQASNQIVVEEYLLHLFGVENEKFPVSISLKKEGKPVTYEITGAISNYSYLMTTPSEGYMETKAYPSIICGQEKAQNNLGGSTASGGRSVTENVKRSFVILQRKLNFKRTEDDILYLLSEISLDNMCINGDLDRGYSDNKDIINMRVFYLALVNLLLLLGQIVMIRAFLLRNKKTFFLLEALGLSHKEKRKIVFYLIQGSVWISFLIGYILAALIGFTYMEHTFREYNKFYMTSLNYTVLAEAVIAGIILLCFYIFCDRNKKKAIIREMGNLIGDLPERRNPTRYRFQKLDIGIVIIETVCIFFTMFSFYFTENFRPEFRDIEFTLCSKRDSAAILLEGYRIGLNGDDYFSFDASEPFDKYKDYVSLSMEAETKQCALLLRKENVNSYFRQFCTEEDEMRPEDESLWEKVADRAEQFTPLNVTVTVLPQKEFHLFLKQNGIDSPALEQNTGKGCVLRLPDYSQEASHSSIEEKGTIQLGGIRGDENHAEFFAEGFRVEALQSCDGEECSDIQVIMSEETAKKSRTVLGYDSIDLNMKNDTPESVQKGVEQEVSLLMASIQGGGLGNSEEINRQNELTRNYGSVLSDTMLLFGIAVVCIYIISGIYIDWEKHSHEYGVLRSFGMGYATLQRKIFFKYSSSIVIASIISIYAGRFVFTDDSPTKLQKVISIAITVGVIYLCRILVYYWKKKQSVSSMISKE